MPDHNNEALVELITRIADDALIMGHRNSEWTGMGPILEEDIAFSSLAQDKIGHAYNLYQLIESSTGRTPDQTVFEREEKEWKCSHFSEFPTGEYDFSLVRHFLYDIAESLRYEHLIISSHQPLASLARKLKGEIKYHVFHANTYIKQLAQGTEESKSRIQSSLDYAFPYALALFEKSPFEDELIDRKIFLGEDLLKDKWLEQISGAIESFGLKVPEATEEQVAEVSGGRKGYHTEYLKPLLDEMCEVHRLDPEAEW